MASTSNDSDNKIRSLLYQKCSKFFDFLEMTSLLQRVNQSLYNASVYSAEFGGKCSVLQEKEGDHLFFYRKVQLAMETGLDKLTSCNLQYIY